MMKRSPVQQMTTVTGNSNWWSINNIISKPVAQHTSSFSAPPPAPPPPPPPPPDLLTHYNTTTTPPPSSSSFWVEDSEELPAQSISWSQLVSAGLVEENDSNRKSGLSYFLQTKNREEENWEEQLLPPSNGGYLSDVRQLLEYSSTQSFMYGSNNDNSEEYQRSTPVKSSWWTTPLPVSPPASCLTTLNSNNNLFVDLSGNLSDGNGRRYPLDHSSEVPKEEKCNSIGGTVGASKKARVQPCSNQSTFKVRKEKLGDRITALHQLVSPFGKTDTASVLLEAIGYIRFLHSQVEALSLPYLGKTSGLRQQQQQQIHQQNDYCEEPKKDLKSRGLCLVPVSSTMQVANDINGADYWAPVLGGGGGGRTGGGFG